MIIIGFPGIGKSSVANKPLPNYKFSGYIDLESSNFVKEDTWVKEYCNTALDLSRQGYKVFLSSHKDVRDYLKDYDDKDIILEIFPSAAIHNEWMRRLFNRYELDPSSKNYRAYHYMRENYYTSVEDMEQDNFQYKIRLGSNDCINDLSKTINDYCIEMDLC